MTKDGIGNYILVEDYFGIVLRCPLDVNRNNSIHMTASVSRRLKYILHNVQDYNVLCNNGVRPAICESWYFTHTWKALAWPAHFTKRGGFKILAPKTSLNTTLFIEVTVSRQQTEWSCICGKHWHDRIISLRGEVRVHKTCLNPPLFIEVPVSRQES